jgi:hypothetical protein
MQEEPIPDAIVEAEAKATPMRPVRQQAYVLIGSVSGVAGGTLAASKQGGIAAADAFANTLPTIVSTEVTEVICAILAVACGYFLYAEERTRQENLERILARVEEKKTQLGGSNRDGRRTKEKEAKKNTEMDRWRAEQVFSLSLDLCKRMYEYIYFTCVCVRARGERACV